MVKVELRIGIVLSYKSAEKKKDELFCVNSKDWLKQEFIDKSHVIKRKNVDCVPADVAIGIFIENYNQQHRNDQIELVVDYISPDEISVERFNQNHIVYIIIYDLLECFHLSKAKCKIFKHALKTCKNVYPPYEYQKFINNKCSYYRYLADKKIPVAPTHCITKQKWFSRDNETYVNKLINKVKENKWKSIIAKPVYGQESKDFAKFLTMKVKKGKKKETDECDSEFCGNDSVGHQNKKHLQRYLSKNIPKYKSIVIQEYIPGFDKSNPEYRMYFIDGVYAYCVVTTDTIVETPSQEGGKFKVSSAKWNYLQRFSKKVMQTLPKFNLPGNLKNPILTRIDIGSGLEGVPHTFFVNEVEFVPSLYIEDQEFPVVEEIAMSLMEVAMHYYCSKLPIKVKF